MGRELLGVSGQLVAQSFLASLSTDEPDAAEALRRRLSPIVAVLQRLGPASSVRAVLEAGAALFGTLGFASVDAAQQCGATWVASARANGRCICLVAAPWAERLDGMWRTGILQARSRSADWCVLFNGVRLRIVDARQLYSRRFIEVDLLLAIDRESRFRSIWPMIRPQALCAAAGDPHSLHALVAASDSHAATVCRALRDGVLTASTELLAALVETGRRRPLVSTLDESFEQAVTIVYRVLFLLFAEARVLVPMWHPVYRDSYSIDALRDAAETSPGVPGFWEALRAITRLAHAGCHAGDLRVTPFNGRLFAPSRTPLAERRDLNDDAARRALLALSTRRTADRSARERIVYRELGVEQLGAVYETLLDYEPVHRGSVTLDRGSDRRKATGTFYTPQAVADYLVRRTLEPLVRGLTADEIVRLRVLDPSMGSGAFLVAASRFLASAYERALIDGGGFHPSDIDETRRTAIRRMIAEKCLYGVDVNPMAVQLARLSLWLATLAADRPLSFLDHRLVVGDSLLGAWLTDLRRPPARRRGSRQHRDLPLFAGDVGSGALQMALPARFAIESTPNDTIEQVRTKERTFAALCEESSALTRWKRVADLWCASWFQVAAIPPNVFQSLGDAILGDACALSGPTAAAYLESSRSVSRDRRFFHWELEFPEVFFDTDGARKPHGGFDAVIGNPPWDMIRADSGGRSTRRDARELVADTVRFVRDTGIYHACLDGHPNRYQLFAERALALTRHGGRIGLVLPSGFAADHGSAPLRQMTLTNADVDAIVGVDNVRRIFPIHRSVRFLLVTATTGSPTRRIACRLGVESARDLDAIGEEAGDPAMFPVQLPVDALRRISGDGLTIPHLRSALDLAICEKAASLFPRLADGWRARFGRELNATDDRDLFLPPGRGIPIVEGKHITPFRVALDRSARSIRSADALARLGPGRFDRPRLGYRDVASSTNRVTLIAAILPARCVSTHTIFCVRTPLPVRDQLFLCGLFNSLVVNFLARLRVTCHVTTGIVESLPIPVDVSAATIREIAALARMLSRGENARAFFIML